MKKRVFSLLLALVLALSAAVLPASAAESFSDVTDKKTAQNAEVLRLLGVMEGDGTGRFNPNAPLTRAEFCKMLVAMMGGEVASYKTVTIFPDVRASHWAAGYINYAVRAQKLLAGLPDGTFRPDSQITYGQAVTILMRMLRSDADKASGGIWPDGYIALAKEAGVSAGLSLSGSAPITRAQAAQMFVNVLSAKSSSTDEDGTTTTMPAYEPSNCKRGDKVVTLISLNGNTIRVSGESKPLNLTRTSTSTVLNGLKGYLLTNVDTGKVMTFVPVVDSSTGAAVTNAAVILSADGSTNGISALTGGRTDYDVYRNGSLTKVSALRKNDVVTYDAAANALYACDTRVSVYYESCEPSAAEPTTIKVLGGTTFDVLPTAQQSLSKFKPGRTMTLLLTNDGAVAGAVEGSYSLRTNAIGIVGSDGKVQMFCGSTMKALSLTDMTVDSNLYGKLVSISSSAAKSVNLYAQSGGVSGSLNVSERKLDGKALAANVMVYQNGALIGLSELTEAVIPQSQITYARTNAGGEIDLIVLENLSTERYGRVVVNSTKITDENGKGPGDDGYIPTYETKIGVDIGTGEADKMLESGYVVRNGDFVAFKYNSAETGFSQIITLTELEKVARSSWIGTGAVNFGGMTYTVPADVLCWNADVNDWFTGGGVEAAIAYGSTMNLYVMDGVVRVIEVRS